MDPAQSVIGFVVALPNEWKYFRAAFSHLHRSWSSGVTFYRGRFGNLECHVAVGGAGKSNAADAVRALLKVHRVDMLVSLGYAGALSPELMRGDIVLSAYSGNSAPAQPGETEKRIEQHLLRMADRSHEHHVYVSPLHTADRIIARHDEKKRLYHETEASIVDMESYSIYQAALRYGVPFIGIHSVTDTAEEDIPALEVITPFLASKSLWRYPRMFWEITRRPKLVIDLAVLNHDAKTAGRTMAHFLKANEVSLSGLFAKCCALQRDQTPANAPAGH